MEIKKIFSKQFAIYLRQKGFRIIGTEVNTYRPEWDVYLFEESEELNAAMLEYTKEFRNTPKKLK